MIVRRDVWQGTHHAARVTCMVGIVGEWRGRGIGRFGGHNLEEWVGVGYR
ncbi:MAG: hypothetical protein H6658_14140 [Ardenticatenaceae bacterium]|nr:hypothetical protein [Ardenticatenaceae bacterium]